MKIYFLVFIVGFLFSGVWFGSILFTRNIIKKKEMEFLDKFSPLLSGLLPAIIINIVFKKHPFNFTSMTNWRLWLIAVITVVITSIIVLVGNKPKAINDDTIWAKCIEASMMEIPQRVMLQTLCCGLLYFFQRNLLLGVLINACIWCADIIVQAIIFKNKNYKGLTVELIASFIFSLGIGYVFYQSECLLIPMLSHASERYATKRQWIVTSRGKCKKSYIS